MTKCVTLTRVAYAKAIICKFDLDLAGRINALAVEQRRPLRKVPWGVEKPRMKLNKWDEMKEEI